MLYVSYYTKETPYKEVMDTYLLPSLKKWDLPYRICSVPNLGNWNLNTKFKAEFLLMMFELYKQDLIFLDADATIEADPVLFNQLPSKTHIAAHLLDWGLHWQGKSTNRLDLLSGTMFFKYCPLMIEITKEYIQKVKESPQWEQKTLQAIVDNHKELNFYNLPPHYCAIQKRNGEVAPYMEPPIILHHQVSRQLKSKVNKRK